MKLDEAARRISDMEHQLRYKSSISLKQGTRSPRSDRSLIEGTRHNVAAELDRDADALRIALRLLRQEQRHLPLPSAP